MTKTITDLLNASAVANETAEAPPAKKTGLGLPKKKAASKKPSMRFDLLATIAAVSDAARENARAMVAEYGLDTTVSIDDTRFGIEAQLNTVESICEEINRRFADFGCKKELTDKQIKAVRDYFRTLFGDTSKMTDRGPSIEEVDRAFYQAYQAKKALPKISPEAAATATNEIVSQVTLANPLSQKEPEAAPTVVSSEPENKSMSGKDIVWSDLNRKQVAESLKSLLEQMVDSGAYARLTDKDADLSAIPMRKAFREDFTHFMASYFADAELQSKKLHDAQEYLAKLDADTLAALGLGAPAPKLDAVLQGRKKVGRPAGSKNKTTGLGGPKKKAGGKRGRAAGYKLGPNETQPGPTLPKLAAKVGWSRFTVSQWLKIKPELTKEGVTSKDCPKPIIEKIVKRLGLSELKKDS